MPTADTLDKKELIGGVMTYLFGYENCMALNLENIPRVTPGSDIKKLENGLFYTLLGEEIEPNSLKNQTKWSTKVLPKLRNDKELMRLLIEQISEMTYRLAELGEKVKSDVDDDKKKANEKFSAMASHALGVLGLLNLNKTKGTTFWLKTYHNNRWVEGQYEIKPLTLNWLTGLQAWGFKCINGVAPNHLVFSGTIPPPSGGVGRGHNIFATIMTGLLPFQSFGSLSVSSWFGVSKPIKDFIAQGGHTCITGISLGGAQTIHAMKALTGTGVSISGIAHNPPMASTHTIRNFTRVLSLLSLTAIAAGILYFSLPVWLSVVAGFGIFTLGFGLYRLIKPHRSVSTAIKNLKVYRNVTNGNRNMTNGIRDWAGKIGDHYIGEHIDKKLADGNGTLVLNHTRWGANLSALINKVIEGNSIIDSDGDQIVKRDFNEDLGTLTLQTIAYNCRAPFTLLFAVFGGLIHVAGNSLAAIRGFFHLITNNHNAPEKANGECAISKPSKWLKPADQPERQQQPAVQPERQQQKTLLEGLSQCLPNNWLHNSFDNFLKPTSGTAGENDPKKNR